MHLDDISEICGKITSAPPGAAGSCPSDPSSHSCPTLGEASTCCLRGQTQTDKHKDRPGEEPVAMLMLRRISGATVTLLCPPGSAHSGAADFSHFHRQPSFSTLLETGHCHLLLSFWAAEPVSVWKSEYSAFFMSRITVVCDGNFLWQLWFRGRGCHPLIGCTIPRMSKCPWA